MGVPMTNRIAMRPDENQKLQIRSDLNPTADTENPEEVIL